MGAEIYPSCSCPRQASYVSSLLIKPATYQSGEICFFLHLSLPSLYGGQFWISPKLPRFQTAVGEPVRRLKKWIVEKRHLWGKSQVGHPSLCREKWTICQMLVSWWMTTGGLMHLLEKLYIVYSSKKEKQMVGTGSWPLLWTVQLATELPN